MKKENAAQNGFSLFEEKIRSEFHEKIIFSFQTSLSTDAALIRSVIAMGENHVFTLHREGEELFARAFDFSLIGEVRFHAYPSSCMCEILYEGAWLVLARGRASERKNLSQFVRILSEIISGALKPQEAAFISKGTSCPKCHRPYQAGSTVCNRCASNVAGFQKLLVLVKPHLGAIFLSMLLFAFTTLLNVYLPSVQKDLVDRYLQTSNPAAALDSIGAMVLLIGFMALIRLVIVVAGIFRNNILTRVSKNTVVKLRSMIYTRIQMLSVAGISKRTAGDLINRVSSDTDTISNFLTNNLPMIIEQVLTLLFVAFIMFSYNWVLALLILIPAPFVALLFRLSWRKTHRLYRRQWVENSAANTVLHDILQGIRVVKVYGTEKKEIENYDRAIASVREICIKTEVTWAKLMPFADFGIQIGNFIVLYFVGNQILKGSMTLGELTMFSAYVSLIYSPLRWMARLPRMIQRASTAVSKVYEIIEEEPDVADSEKALEIDMKGNVEIRNIYFGYDENENVLEDVSVTVRPGEMLGIVGKSGVGKSTLINLIMRLYDVNKGEILIDGINIKDIAQHSLRSQIGVVLQETFLFQGTIFENIAYAKPDASYEEVIGAARMANAHSFIIKLPDGYNTLVGEKGYTLSGGERQRVAIARAVLHDPKILILDEATSALDTETEKMVQDALTKLCRNRTTIAIAHRLSTLRNATKLLVLDKKTVAEYGTHDELMQKEGIYHSLVMAQREMSAIRKKEIPKSEEIV